MSRKKFLTLVNPHSGIRRGQSILNDARLRFESGGIDLDVQLTRHAGHAETLARTLNLNDYDGLCLVRGDGTFHEVVCGLMTRSHPVTLPIGLIPGGTGNTVLQHFHCVTPQAAIERILAGQTQPLDITKVTMDDETSYLANVLGWGTFVDINQTAERLRVLGYSRYAMAALAHIVRPKRRHASITLDSQKIEGEFLLAAACNTQFTGNGMKLAPQAHASDGKLDVVLVEKATRFQLLQLFMKVFGGTHTSLPCIQCHQVKTFTLEHEGPDCLTIDGELKSSTPFSLEIVPAALKIFA